MSRVAIYKCKNPGTTPQSPLEHVEATTDSIRKRPFDVFRPTSELVDDEKEFRARIALPGFDAKDIQLSAMPDALVIQAAATHTHEGKSGNVCLCEFSGKKLFRRLHLPASIDVDKVTASVDKGILEVTAPKATTK